MLKLAYNDEERGWNNAIIMILKSNAPGLDPQIVFNARISFSHTLSGDQIKEIYDCYSNQSKLGAVKRYKDFSGLGLKEAKEECDKFFQLLDIYKTN